MEEPREASFRSWSGVPVAGVSPAIRIATAGTEPARALVRCLTGTVILSFDANELNTTGQAVAGNTYRITAGAIGQSEAIVMNPGQVLYAAAVAVGGPVAISVALSDAFPVKVH